MVSTSSRAAEGGSHIARLSRNAQRILWVLSPVGGLIWGWEFGLSVLLGGLLAVVNFRFMKSGIDRVLGRRGRDSNRPVLTGYLGRFVLILLGLFAMIHFSFLSLLGAVLGLSIFVWAGVFEAIYLLVHGSN